MLGWHVAIVWPRLKVKGKNTKATGAGGKMRDPGNEVASLNVIGLLNSWITNCPITTWQAN